MRELRAGPERPAARAFRALSGSMLLLGLIGGWGPGVLPAAVAEEESPAPAAGPGAENPAPPAPEGAQAGGDPPIDCLLPADITRLGGQVPHIGPRRLIQVPEAECRSRGGEEVAPGAGPDPDPSSR